MVHVGNLLVSEDGAFATYKCKTLQDIMWSDDQWKRTGQSDGCRKREVQLLTKRLDEARDRIKRLEDCIHRAAMAFFRDGSDGQVASQMLQILEEERGQK
jgi:5-bromo-4-chloroindolyl phosphate hydrolysis protein